MRFTYIPLRTLPKSPYKNNRDLNSFFFVTNLNHPLAIYVHRDKDRSIPDTAQVFRQFNLWCYASTTMIFS